MTSLRKQRGSLMLDVIFGLVIIAALIPTFITWQTQGNESTIEAVAAQQLQQVVSASGQYINDNYATLVTATNGGVTVTINVTGASSLQSLGYLSGVGSYTNPWGQTYKLYVNQPTANNLQGVVISSGGEFATPTSTGADKHFMDVIIPATAAKVGAAGGFIASGNLPNTTVNDLRGANGGWDIPKASLTAMGISTANTSAGSGIGHLGAYVYMSQSGSSNDYLYRVAIPGSPQLNQMQTNLDMGNNNVNNANNISANGEIGTNGKSATTGYTGVATSGIHTQDVQADGAISVGNNAGNPGVSIVGSTGTIGVTGDVKNATNNFYLSKSVQNITEVGSGTVITLPTCLAGETADIYTSVASFYAPSGLPISSVQTYATGTTVFMRVLTQNGYEFPSYPYGSIQVITKCD